MGYRVLSTVTAAASSYALTTVAAVKGDLGITNTDSDAYLTTVIDRASQSINQACNRVFVVEGIRDTFYPEREFYSYQVSGGIPSLQLSRWPIVSVSSVTENGDTLTVDTDYQIDAENGLLIRLDGLGYPTPWKPWQIVVAYTAGYATIPADVEEACARLVKARWSAKSRDPYLKAEQIEGIGRMDYWVSANPSEGNLPPDIADALDNYRVPVVA